MNVLSKLKSKLWPNWQKIPKEAITARPGLSVFNNCVAFVKIRVYREKENRWYDLVEHKSFVRRIMDYIGIKRW